MGTRTHICAAPTRLPLLGLAFDPTDRISAADALRHPYYAEYADKVLEDEDTEPEALGDIPLSKDLDSCVTMVYQAVNDFKEDLERELEELEREGYAD